MSKSRPAFTKKEREAAMRAGLVEQPEARTMWRDPKKRGCY